MFWLKRLKKKIADFDIFELGNSFCLYYFLIFIIFPLLEVLKIPHRYIRHIALGDILLFDARFYIYSFLGLLAFALGYWLWKPGFGAKSNFLRLDWKKKRVFWVWLCVFAVSLIIKVLRIYFGGYFHLGKSIAFVNNPFYSLIGSLEYLSLIAIGLAFAYYFHLLSIKSNPYKLWRGLAWSALGLELTYGLFSGSRFAVIAPIIIYLIAKHYLVNRSYKRIIVALLLIFFIIIPGQNFYRNHQSVPKAYFPINLSEVIGKQDSRAGQIGQFVFDSSFGRMNQSLILANVLKKTESFSNGKSLMNFFISLGPPRFIWKNKPVINASGNELGRKLGILNPIDFNTNIGPTLVGDWYMNFGFPGIVLGMFFIGLLCRFFYSYLMVGSNFSLSGVILYGIVWLHVIKGLEDQFAPVYAGLVKILIISAIICLILEKKPEIGFTKNKE